MVGARREVARLSLTAGSEEDVSRGRILVEDALRVASFPPAPGGRLLVIRRLDLGVVDPHRSSAVVSNVIEEALRVAEWQAVGFDEPDAARADVVWCPDRIQAIAALVAKLAAGVIPGEWFWPSLVPGWRPGSALDRSIPAALAGMLDEPGGVAQLAAVIDELRCRDQLSAVLARLAPPDGVFLLAACGLPAQDGAWADDPVAHGSGASPMTRRWRDALVTWSARWTPTDARTRWLATMAVLSANPRSPVDTAVLACAVGVLREARGTSGPSDRPNESQAAHADQGKAAGMMLTDLAATRIPDPARAASSASGLRKDKPDESERWPWVRRDGAGVLHRPVHARVGVARPARAPDGRGARAKVPSTREAEGPGRGPELRPTAGAGLLFAVPLLERLGIRDAGRAWPALLKADVGARLLERVADGAAVPRDDAIRDALHVGRDGEESPPEAGPWMRAWHTRLQRACRRQGAMRLAALVRRAGWVAATRTNVDVVLRLADADLRIRRAGLDLDPGWVPWLGRIVIFHYTGEP